MPPKPRIAHLAGSNATIQNSPPLVTSNKARVRHGLPLLTNADGTTPLMAAAGFGCTAPDEEAGTEEECLAAVEYLLKLGLDVDAKDKNGETAMHGAAFKQLPKMVHLLDEKGAKLDVWNQKDKNGWTPLIIAEGFRPGNFKPSFETIEAIHQVMKKHGVTPPPPTPRPDAGPMGYDKKDK
jgi:hypothetical protein